MEESILDLLIPFLTFIFIVGGSLVKSASDKNKAEQNQPPKTRRSQSSGQNVNPKRRETIFNQFEVDESQLKEQKDKQIEKVKKDLSISTKATVSNEKSSQDLEKLLQSRSKNRTMSKKDMNFKSYFTRKGLAGSVVMA